MSDAVYIQKCTQQIEESLAWGSSKNWQNKDYELLSEQILDKTGIALSVSTLKRLWGKIKYDSTPNVSTLNALARFAGFESWRNFTADVDQKQNSVKNLSATDIVVNRSGRPIRVLKIVLIGGGALFLGLMVVMATRNKTKQLSYSNISFASSPVTQGLPNTVMFKYNVRESNADSVFVQQSWDPKLRFRVDKDKSEYAATYYYPGFYKAKLVLNDVVVKEHDLYIETEGWLGTIDKNQIPEYFSKIQVVREKEIGIDEGSLRSRGIDPNKELPKVSLFNISKRLSTPSDNFYFKTSVKSVFNTGDAVCQKVNIILLCQSGYHSIPLSIKGCVGELKLVLGNENHEGKTTNLASFGVDLSDWVSVKCRVLNKHALIYVKDQLAYEGSFSTDVGNIVGYRFQFEGGGLVKNTELSKLQ
jgi:hypothetical protein